MDLTNWWVKTHQETSSAEQMWDSWQAPHRDQLVVALHCIPDLDSVYEVACGAGPNLRRLKDDYCHPMTLGGSEPCEGLAAWASEHLGVTIDRLALPDVPDGTSWDAVLSCYALAYCDPEAAIQSLTNFKKLGARYLILMEPNAYVHPYEKAGLYSRGGALPEWAHDYPNLLRETGWGLLWRWPFMPPTDGLNTILIAEQESA